MEEDDACKVLSLSVQSLVKAHEMAVAVGNNTANITIPLCSSPFRNLRTLSSCGDSLHPAPCRMQNRTGKHMRGAPHFLFCLSQNKKRPSVSSSSEKWGEERRDWRVREGLWGRSDCWMAIMMTFCSRVEHGHTQSQQASLPGFGQNINLAGFFS